MPGTEQAPGSGDPDGLKHGKPRAGQMGVRAATGAQVASCTAIRPLGTRTGTQEAAEHNATRAGRGRSRVDGADSAGPKETVRWSNFPLTSWELVP